MFLADVLQYLPMHVIAAITSCMSAKDASSRAAVVTNTSSFIFKEAQTGSDMHDDGSQVCKLFCMGMYMSSPSQA